MPLSEEDSQVNFVDEKENDKNICDKEEDENGNRLLWSPGPSAKDLDCDKLMENLNQKFFIILMDILFPKF